MPARTRRLTTPYCTAPQIVPQEYRDYSCVMSLGLIYCIFVALWVGYFFLAIYIDAIIPNEFGVSKPPWYIFMPSYWSTRFG